MFNPMRSFLVIFVFIVLPSILYSTIINIPADYATIQAGINASINRDTILVQPGTYVENVNFIGRKVIVGSLFLTTQDQAYISSTIIDGDNNGSVVKFTNNEDSIAVLSGFTIVNGYLPNGGGIYCYEASPCLNNLIIKNNSASSGGGGIGCINFSDPTIQNTLIFENSAPAGGGIYCDESSPNLQNVTITDNSGRGIYCNWDSTPVLINSILWNNLPEEIYINSGSVTAIYSDIQGGWTGTGNIDTNPLFVDSLSEDFHLQLNSPCIDTGDPTSNLDPDGTRADMGAYYYSQIIAPEADFIGDSTNGDAPLAINFIDISTQGTGVIDEWYWDFGDGNTSTLQNPSNEYLLPGVYTVSLTVTDENDSTDTKIKVDYITVNPISPITNFIADVTNGGVPLTVSFTDISTQGTGIIDEWYWDFGDGNNSTLQNPINEYLATGTYTVSLTVTDIYDSTDTENKVDYITVNLPDYSGPVWHISTAGSDAMGNGTEQFPFATIQHGIDTSANTDTILVNSGTYLENINYNGKLITLGSLFLTTQDTSYISSTIIDGNHSGGSVVTFTSSEDSNAVLTGFRIINGFAEYGGGIYCNNGSSPNIESVVISGNHTEYSGGGIYCNTTSSPSIKNVTISYNYSTIDGGGIYCDNGSSPSIKNVTISDNHSANDGGGICYNNGSRPNIDSVIISDNESDSDGGGIYIYYDNTSNSSIKNVTISGNQASRGGAIYYGRDSSNPNLQNITISYNSSNLGGGIYIENTFLNLERVTMFDNSAPAGGEGIYCVMTSALILTNSILWGNDIYGNIGNIIVTYSDIEGGWTGTGNIDSDPLFIDQANGDFHLQSASPCIDAGDPDPQYDDPDGTIADMGAYYFYHITPPDVDFVADTTNGYATLSVNFSDISTHGSGVMDEWYWDFGDGNNSLLQNPSNEYLSPGFYPVSLTVTADDDSTDTETKVDYITVFSTDPPAAPSDVQINTVGDDATLTWAVVDTTFTGYPANVDAYLVYYSEIPDEDSLFFFHGLTTETTYTHPYVVKFSDHMFYQVASYTGDLKSLQDFMMEHPKFKRRELDLFMEEKKEK